MTPRAVRSVTVTESRGMPTEPADVSIARAVSFYATTPLIVYIDELRAHAESLGLRVVELEQQRGTLAYDSKNGWSPLGEQIVRLEAERDEALRHASDERGWGGVMSETPRTDAAWKWRGSEQTVTADFARQLERDLTARREADEGYVRVPRVPTREMIAAAVDHDWSGGYDRQGSHASGQYEEYRIGLVAAFGTYGCETAATEIYKAMLAAAPSGERGDE